MKQAEAIPQMAVTTIPHFQNDAGLSEIRIGVKEFMCCGANEPHDHPHVFLDMGEDGQIVCPYCSTLYKYQAELKADESEPAGCLAKNV